MTLQFRSKRLEIPHQEGSHGHRYHLHFPGLRLGQQRQRPRVGHRNVWRFPYIAGEYGGAAFIVLYLIFLVILGLPVMVMEFAVGRASQRSAAQAFDILQPSRRWHWFSWWAYIGCMLLMMFYTTVCGCRRASSVSRK